MQAAAQDLIAAIDNHVCGACQPRAAAARHRSAARVLLHVLPGAKFEPCQEASGSDPHLTEGKSVATCEMFLVPENVQPVFVGFQGDRDYRDPTLETGTAPEVVWKAG
ncbi:hypothetical protein [Streptomyces sp. NPDC001194]|uniref:hypothetical protein n=1 Tax=Streptomyces sp. NPDC001194 TaxID=3364547 RepID=UPI0036AE71F3